MLALSGVKLNVTGAEHLTERRPAVFLFNFRSNIDVFLVAALVKDNWTGVATREMANGRVFGQLGKLLDVAFVDRAHPETSAGPGSLAAAARKGLSILIPPEGTRFDTESVGPFKKRPFVIAMATGLPIVPIVIRNSESVAGRNTAKLNPGTVDIAVLPPVSVAGWTLLNMRGRIARVRAAYVETLAEWPTGEPGNRPGTLSHGVGPYWLPGPGGDRGGDHQRQRLAGGMSPSTRAVDPAARVTVSSVRSRSRFSDSLSPSGTVASRRELSCTSGRSMTASIRLARLPAGAWP